MRVRSIIVAFVVAFLATAPAAAQEADDGFGRKSVDPAYLSLGGGWFDVVEQDDEAVDLRLEYRHGRRFWWFKPWAGLELTGDGGLWAGGGLLVDLHLGEHIVLTGLAGVGAHEEGDGKDLGATTEFRTQGEIAWRFADRSRLALAFSHISNAGLGDDNPGAEIVTLYYHMPLSRLTRALGN